MASKCSGGGGTVLASGIRTRERKERKLYSDDWALGDEEIEGHHTFDLQEKMTTDKFNMCMVKDMTEVDFDLGYMQKNGFNWPLLFREKKKLGIEVPGSDFSINDVRQCVGSRRMLDVMDVNTQKNVEMTMKDWQRYFESKDKDKLLNVISLEFSHTKLESLVHAPEVVRQIDWVERVWPRHLKEAQTESTNVLEDMMYPKVQKYCLMSVSGCYTDFHIDFGGTSVWYHVLRGKKIFWLIPPTERNLQLYEQWVLSGKQSDIFFGDTVEKCARVELKAGYTFFIPTGWIHAVYTPEDSLVFGGNFLHSFGIEKQLRVAQVEDTTHVPQKFRYPFFTEMLWYVLERYVHVLLGRTHLTLPDEEEYKYQKYSDDKAKQNNNDTVKEETDESKEIKEEKDKDKVENNEVVKSEEEKHVHLTQFELHGLKAIVMYLHALPTSKKCVPELIHDPIALIRDVRTVVERHRYDTADMAITSKPVLEWWEREPIKYGLKRQLVDRTELEIVKKRKWQKKTPSDSNVIQGPPPNINKSKRRRVRCKQCKACVQDDCRECNFCQDMVKYGGAGVMKQTCKEKKCAQPSLPAKAACYLCDRDGWGRVISTMMEKPPVKKESNLMECCVCFQISHQKCIAKEYETEGIVNEDLPNCWECPECVNLGYNKTYQHSRMTSGSWYSSSDNGGKTPKVLSEAEGADTKVKQENGHGTEGDKSIALKKPFKRKPNKSNTTVVQRPQPFKRKPKVPDQNKLYAHENDENQAPPTPLPPKLKELPEKVNPFCDDVLEFLLSSLDEPVYKRAGYCRLNGKFPVLSTGRKLRLGKERYHIKSTRFQGAYATVFQGSVMDSLNGTLGGGGDESDDSDNDDEKQRVLKAQKPSFPWEFYICNELRQRLKSLGNSSKIADSVMRVNRAYFFDQVPELTGSILINQYHKYGTLLSAFNKYKVMGISVPEELAMIIMVEVLAILSAMHKCQIIHADIKPDNFLIMRAPKINMNGVTVHNVFAQCPSAIKLIDFGRSIDMKLLPPGTKFTEKVKTDGFTCCEMREDRPWTYQTDYYGAAAIAHVMLWGTYLNIHKDNTGRWNVKNSYKRYWNRTLWEDFFVTMLNVPSCEELPDLEKIKLDFMNAFIERKNIDMKLMSSQFENVMKQVCNDGTEKKKSTKKKKKKVEYPAVASPHLTPQKLDFSTPKIEKISTPKNKRNKKQKLQNSSPKSMRNSINHTSKNSIPHETQDSTIPHTDENSVPGLYLDNNLTSMNSTPNETQDSSIPHAMENSAPGLYLDNNHTSTNLTPNETQDSTIPHTVENSAPGSYLDYNHTFTNSTPNETQDSTIPHAMENSAPGSYLDNNHTSTISTPNETQDSTIPHTVENFAPGLYLDNNHTSTNLTPNETQDLTIPHTVENLAPGLYLDNNHTFTNLTPHETQDSTIPHTVENLAPGSYLDNNHTFTTSKPHETQDSTIPHTMENLPPGMALDNNHTYKNSIPHETQDPTIPETLENLAPQNGTANNIWNLNIL